MSTNKNILDSLRNSQFNLQTENLLCNHPFVKDAESGILSMDQLKRFVCEQYYIQQSDLKSLLMMAEKCKGKQKACYDFFKILSDGEIYAAELITTMAKWLNVSQKDLLQYNCSMKAQVYPSYLARCAIYERPEFVAIACSVNFPTWGRMCERLYNSILNLKDKYGAVSPSDLSFLKFFATPIDGFDKMALDCLNEGGFDDNFDDKSLNSVVRLLQEGEVMFWDSVYSGN